MHLSVIILKMHFPKYTKISIDYGTWKSNKVAVVPRYWLNDFRQFDSSMMIPNKGENISDEQNIIIDSKNNINHNGNKCSRC